MEAEDLDFHRRVREGYLTQAREHPVRFVVIDASADADEVAAEIWKRYEAYYRCSS